MDSSDAGDATWVGSPMTWDLAEAKSAPANIGTPVSVRLIPWDFPTSQFVHVLHIGVELFEDVGDFRLKPI